MSAYAQCSHADVAELVDAQVSEACCRKAVEVRFFSSAPFFSRFFSRESNQSASDFFCFAWKI